MFLSRAIVRALRPAKFRVVRFPFYSFTNTKPNKPTNPQQEQPVAAEQQHESQPQKTPTDPTATEPKPAETTSTAQTAAAPQPDPSTVSRIGQMVKKAWRITFPNEQDEVKRKFEERKKKALLKPKYTTEDLEKMQLEIPEERRTALAETKIQVKEEKKSVKSRIIPEAVKSKLQETDLYKKASEVHKEYTGFKEDLKEYISSKDNLAVQATVAAYGKVSRGSQIARAIQYMRENDPEFEPEDLEAQATHIFITSYENFLQGNAQQLQKTCNDQALDFFKSHINLFRTRKVKPKVTKLWDHNICQLITAKFDDKSPPTFIYRIQVQEIYCFEDPTGKIVDGDQERLMRSTFEYGIKASGDKMEIHGHNWEIIEIRKIDEIKLLV